jgi:hypothetical protein
LELIERKVLIGRQCKHMADQVYLCCAAAKCRLPTLTGGKMMAPGQGLEGRMRFRRDVILVMIGLVTPLVFAAPESVAADEQYVPRLADIMSTVQLRHMKLWFAGGSPNWDLAAFELLRLKDSLVEAASLYPDIPVTSVTTMAKPIQAVADAIGAKDTRMFASTFGELTVACNTCHQSVGRGFVVMRVPTASPFSDQVFPPQNKP